MRHVCFVLWTRERARRGPLCSEARWHREAAGESGQRLQQVKCSIFVSTAAHLFESTSTKGHKMYFRQMAHPVETSVESCTDQKKVHLHTQDSNSRLFWTVPIVRGVPTVFNTYSARCTEANNKKRGLEALDLSARARGFRLRLRQNILPLHDKPRLLRLSSGSKVVGWKSVSTLSEFGTKTPTCSKTHKFIRK